MSLFSNIFSTKSHCLHHCEGQITDLVNRQRKERLLENMKDKYPALIDMLANSMDGPIILIFKFLLHQVTQSDKLLVTSLGCPVTPWLQLAFFTFINCFEFRAIVSPVWNLDGAWDISIRCFSADKSLLQVIFPFFLHLCIIFSLLGRTFLNINVLLHCQIRKYRQLFFIFLE